MATDRQATTFVTGAAGFIGSELVKLLVALHGWVYGNGGWFRELITRVLVSPVLADQLRADAVFSNIRLRGIGFGFLYPTLEHGLQQVVGALDE